MLFATCKAPLEWWITVNNAGLTAFAIIPHER